MQLCDYVIRTNWASLSTLKSTLKEIRNDEMGHTKEEEENQFVAHRENLQMDECQLDRRKGHKVRLKMDKNGRWCDTW